MNNRPLILSIFNLLGRVINVILYIVVANLYGANQSTDWFFFVYAIAHFFIGICYYATESALVPAWHRLPKTEHYRMLRLALKTALYLLPVIGVILLSGGFYLAPRRGIESPYTTVIALPVCLVLALLPPLAFLSSFFSSYRQFKQQYVMPTIHLALRTVGVLAVLFVVPSRSIMVLALAYLAGELFRLLCLQSGQFRGEEWRTGQAILSEVSFRSIYGHVAWMTLALMCTVINPVIDLAMVGGFPGGSVTLVEYAGRLRGMPVLALGGILIYILGEWSYQHHRQEDKLAWRQVSTAFWKLTLFCLPVVIILMISEKLWVPLFFFSRQFSSANLQQLQQLLYWYFPGVVFLAGSTILSRAVLVIQRVKLMALITLVAAGLNVVCNFFLLKMMGLQGVALSTTAVDVFVCGAYYLLVRRSLRRLV